MVNNNDPKREYIKSIADKLLDKIAYENGYYDPDSPYGNGYSREKLIKNFMTATKNTKTADKNNREDLTN